MVTAPDPAAMLTGPVERDRTTAAPVLDVMPPPEALAAAGAGSDAPLVVAEE